MADPIPRRADATKATLSADVFDDPNWIVERKLDGFRCLAFRDGGPVELESRNRLSLNQRYPEVAAALEEAPSKRFVWFEHSAHEVMSEEPGKVLVSLVSYALPIAAKAGDVAPEH